MKLPFEGCVLKEYPAGNISQYFGENPTLYGRFGMKGHNGIDLVAKHGTTLVAVEDCKVINVKDSPEGYGKHVRLISTKSYNGLYREWTYGHCSVIYVDVGDTLREGDDVAAMGNTGFVISGQTPFWAFNPYAGTHEHLGLRMLKKSTQGWCYPGSNVKITVPDYENGYKGSIDPLPAFGISTEPTVANLEAQVSLLTKVLELLKKLKSIK